MFALDEKTINGICGKFEAYEDADFKLSVIVVDVYITPIVPKLVVIDPTVSLDD